MHDPLGVLGVEDVGAFAPVTSSPSIRSSGGTPTVNNRSVPSRSHSCQRCSSTRRRIDLSHGEEYPALGRALGESGQAAVSWPQ